MLSKLFTTGKVAALLGVAPRTVSKWFDSGRLRGYRIPGSQDRRIPENCLCQFLAEYGMPFPDEVGFVITDGTDHGFVVNADSGECIANRSIPIEAARMAQRFSSEEAAGAVLTVRKASGLGGKVIRVSDLSAVPAEEAVSV